MAGEKVQWTWWLVLTHSVRTAVKWRLLRCWRGAAVPVTGSVLGGDYNLVIAQPSLGAASAELGSYSWELHWARWLARLWRHSSGPMLVFGACVLDQRLCAAAYV